MERGLASATAAATAARTSRATTVGSMDPDAATPRSPSALPSPARSERSISITTSMATDLGASTATLAGTFIDAPAPTPAAALMATDTLGRPLSVAQQILLAAQSRRRNDGPDLKPRGPTSTKSKATTSSSSASARPRLVSSDSDAGSDATSLLSGLIAAASGHRPKRSYAMRAMLAGIGEDEEIAVMESSYHKLMQASRDRDRDSNPAAILAMSIETDDADRETTRGGPMQRAELRAAPYYLWTPSGLACLAFFLLFGGPVASEPTLATAGPFAGFLGLALFPLLVTLPLLVLLLELATTFPHNGGLAAWTKNVSGTFWGVVAGYGVWFASLCDRAMYVRVLAAYVVPAATTDSVRAVVHMALAVGLTIPSLLSTPVLSRVQQGVLAVLLSAVLSASLWEFSQTQSSQSFGEIRRDNITFSSSSSAAPQLDGSIDVDWADYLHVLFWNFDGVPLLAVVSAQVAHPVLTYRRALIFGCGIGWLCYMVPALAAIADEQPHWTQWSGNAAYVTVARQVGGPILRALVTIGAGAGIVGMFFSETMCERIHLAGLAEATLLPPKMKQRDSRIPTIVSLFLITLILLTPEEPMLRVRNSISAATQLIFIVTFARLRQMCELVPRPIRLRGNTLMIMLVLLIPMAVLVGVVLTTVHDPPHALAVVGIGAVGSLVGIVRRRQYMPRPVVSRRTGNE